MATKAGSTHPIGVLSCYSCVSTFPAHGDFEFYLPSKHGWVSRRGGDDHCQKQMSFLFCDALTDCHYGMARTYYRPQTKFAKVVFSQVSVCPQGGGICPIACWDTPLARDQRQTPPSWADAPCKVHAGIRSTSGRYASHWNVFLLNLDALV